EIPPAPPLDRPADPAADVPAVAPLPAALLPALLPALPTPMFDELSPLHAIDIRTAKHPQMRTRNGNDLSMAATLLKIATYYLMAG
ncbi:MAG TPA: hypothetical protein VJV78_13445, partial [Polyangiales bacterium]|nr:hypothetical protein [Polyangiales bacterium]